MCPSGARQASHQPPLDADLGTLSPARLELHEIHGLRGRREPHLGRMVTRSGVIPPTRFARYTVDIPPEMLQSPFGQELNTEIVAPLTDAVNGALSHGAKPLGTDPLPADTLAGLRRVQKGMPIIDAILSTP
jgi:hypothetical protein